MPPGRIRKAKPLKTTTTTKSTAPAYLDDLAKREYAKLVDVLADSGNLAKTDAKLIEAYAGNYSLLVRSITELNNSPLLFGDERKFVNPLVAVVHNATQKVRQIIADLGLSPASAKQVSENLPSSDAAAKWADLVD